MHPIRTWQPLKGGGRIWRGGMNIGMTFLVSYGRYIWVALFAGMAVVAALVVSLGLVAAPAVWSKTCLRESKPKNKG